MSCRRHPTIEIGSVHVEERRDLFESRNTDSLAKPGFQHADVTTRANTQLAREILLSETSVHAGGTNELTDTFRAFRCHGSRASSTLERVNRPLLSNRTSETAFGAIELRSSLSSKQGNSNSCLMGSGESRQTEFLWDGRGRHP